MCFADVRLLPSLRRVLVPAAAWATFFTCAVYTQPLLAVDMAQRTTVASGPSFKWALAALLGIPLAAIAGYWLAQRRREMPVKEPQSEVSKNRTGDYRSLDTLRSEERLPLFAAGLAEALRGPLMSMKTLVQLATERGPHGQLDGYDLRLVGEEIVRLQGFIDRFVDFAQAPVLERSDFDLWDVVFAAIEQAGGRARLQQVRIVCSQRRHAVKVHADRTWIFQVLMHLLTNALDVLPGGGQIDVTVGDCPAPGERPASELAAAEAMALVKVQIADSGPGLPGELAERIFEPFVGTRRAGIGLGLAISRQVVEAHGGYITAENRTGGGAAFTLSLPTRPAAEPELAVDEVIP